MNATPPLPTRWTQYTGQDGPWCDLYTADDMRAYAAQCVAAAQVPLTEEQINALPEAAGWWPMGLNDRIMRLIRAIERAHGIRAKP